MQTRSIIALCKCEEIKAPTNPYVELKHDGYFAVIRTDQGKEEVVTRTPTWLQKQHTDWWQKLFSVVPKDSVCVAELYVPGKDSAAMRSALAENPTESLEFAIFGAMKWRGEDVRQEPRHVIDQLAFPHVPGTIPASNIEAPAAGYDGWVQKETLWPRFIKDWKKIKPSKRIDLRWNGQYRMGKDDFAGMVGSLKLESDDGKISCYVSGMSMEMRLAFTRGEIPVGSVCEVSYKSVASKGGLRHPQFELVRYDKSETSTHDELR